MGGRGSARGWCAARALRTAARAAFAALIAATARAQDASAVQSLDELLAPAAAQAEVQRPADGWDADSVTALTGTLFERLGAVEPGLAFANARRCREGLERVGADRSLTAYYTWQVAWIAREIGRYELACEELRHGVAVHSLGDAIGLSMQVDLADVLQGAGCWRDARAALAEAAAYLEPRAADVDAERILRAEAIGRWYGVQGEIDLKLGLPERAAARFERELEWAQAARKDQLAALPDKSSNLRWAALDRRLKLALAVGDFAGVDRELSRAMSDPLYSDWGPDVTAQFNVHAGAARYERERRGETGFPDARATLESVLAEPYARPVDLGQARSQLLKLATERADWALARTSIDALRAAIAGGTYTLCGGDADTVTLDTFDARVRFETAKDDAERRAALADLETAFAVFLRAWSEAPDRAGGIAFLRYGERYLVLDELIRLSLAVDGPDRGARRALQALGDAQLLGSLALEWKLPSKPLDEWLAPLVRDGAGVLLLQPGRLRSTLFLVDGAGIVVRDIEAGWKLQDRLGALQRAVARAVHASGERSAPPTSEASQLADALLPADLRPRVAGWTNAWVIGDESFGHLAIELLPVDGASASGAAMRRFGDVVPICYVPSLPVAAELATRAFARGVEAPEQLLAGVVAAPTVTGASADRWRPAPLEIDGALWERWSDVWGGRLDARIGVDATPAALCAAAERGVDVLQVVSHGIEDLDRDASAGLLLAGDGGELWSDALTGSMPRVVLLAACQIDARPVRRGDDGRAGWAGRFAIGGSDCVVLTPLDLEVDRALEFFELAQLALRSGASPAAALMHARRELARSGVRAQDYLIYAWGAGSQPVVQRGPGAGIPAAGPALKIATASIVLLAVAVFVIARRVARRTR